AGYCSRSAVPWGGPPQRWLALEHELEEALVPRKMAVSPLESWLSLRYSLPPQESATIIQLLPSVSSEGELPRLPPPAHRDGGGAAVPLLCKNVLEIRRRKMNRHKYKKLLKRTKFLRRRVSEGRRKRKQVSVREEESERGEEEEKTGECERGGE
ncbi:UNVERIFIED_CONTAM: hypothetical protein FKN15_000402, partial [Acipenser sinensis]